MKTLVLTNQKGGVGKSAIATQLAYYFADQLKLRVLFIDLDHQANSSKALKTSGLATVSALTSSFVLNQKVDLEDAAFLLLAADSALVNIEKQGTQHNSFATNLRDNVAALGSKFDVCIIDTNPNPDIRQVASLVVADYVLSPIQLNQEAIDGIGALLNDPRLGIRKIKQALNPKLEFLGLLPNQVEPTPFQQNNFRAIAGAYKSLMLHVDDQNEKLAFIPTRTAVAEAQAAGLPIWKLGKTSAKECWKLLNPIFDSIARRMGV